MPALPAGLRKTPVDSEIITTTGLFQKISGTSSGTKLQATTTVRTPVAVRSMRRGATNAPSTPQTPAAVSTRPIDHGAKPPWISRTVGGHEERVDDQVGAHPPDQDRAEERPRPLEPQPLGDVGAGPAAYGASVDGTGHGGEVGADPAEQHPGDREGHRVEQKGHPPGDGEQRAAERAADQAGHVLAGLLLGQGGGQLLGGYDGPHGGHLGGREHPGADAGQHADHEQVRDRERTQDAGHDQGRIEEDPDAGRRPHHLPAVPPVREQSARQQRDRRAQELEAAGKPGQQRRAGDGVGDQREDEHAHPGPELADRLADPEDGEVVVLAEVAEAGHMRNVTCATFNAQ